MNRLQLSNWPFRCWPALSEPKRLKIQFAKRIHLQTKNLVNTKDLERMLEKDASDIGPVDQRCFRTRNSPTNDTPPL
jgi:hypothetical protein